jgi:CRISPR-associated Csx2 family protein
MARNVFISILGVSYYEEVKYHFGDENIKNGIKSRFIQEAAINHFCKDWKEPDKCYIFLTDFAKKQNWNHPAQAKNRDNKKKYKGLSEILKDNNLVKEIPILDGNNEKEIWNIFETVYDVLEEKDCVYFDITHAFRSIPMLVMVLINYAKFLKKIEVKSITYGNFEARKDNMAPVIDLTAFSYLQDWAGAANEFIQFGNADNLMELSDDEALTNLLTKFTYNFTTCRGIDIFSGETSSQLSRELEKINIDGKLFSHIIKEIKNKTNSFEENNIINNGLAAVDYCIKHKLFQQGITLLTEFIITYLLIYIGKDWKDETNRNTISGCLNLNKLENYNTYSLAEKLQRKIDNNSLVEQEKNEILKEQQDIAEKVFNLPFKKKISDKIFKNLSQGSRNDINHGGIRSNPKKCTDFSNSLKKYYNEIKKIIQEFPC